MLQQQAASQDQFDVLKDQIYEYWPKLATRIEELNNRLIGAIQGTYKDYYQRRFGDNSPAYKIITSDSTWKYVKKKKKELKIKDESNNLLALFENNNRISANFSRDEENRIVGTGNWGLIPDDTTIKSWGTNGGTIPYTSYSYDNETRTYMTFVDNVNKYELPRQGGGARRKELMRNGTYIRAMIYNALNTRFKNVNIAERITNADTLIKELRDAIIEATDLLLSIDSRLVNATTVTELQDIYNSIMELYGFTASINNDELQYCIDTQYEIDRIFKTHLTDLFNSIEFMRKQINEEVGNKGKFGIQWPESARSIINSYIPGKTFDNYLPVQEE